MADAKNFSCCKLPQVQAYLKRGENLHQSLNEPEQSSKIIQRSVGGDSSRARTPQRSRKKREASKSPLQELDGDSELEDAEDPGTYTRLSAGAIADIVRHEIQSGLSPVQSRLGAFQTAFESRMDGIDQQL